MEDKVLREGKFRCSHYKACEASKRPGDVFLEGTMSHVGRRFDLRLGNKPLRIVVVGQEAKSSKMTLEKRRMGPAPPERYYADDEHPYRNPHMRGTTSALRVIFGNGLGADYEGEWVYPVNGNPFHIFNGFALVNRLLCYAGPEKGSQARPTPTMFSNCGSHFSATMSILEPTIVILQGHKVTNWTKKATVLVPSRTFSQYLYEARLGQNRVLVCTFSHPSARDPFRWGANLDAPYLTDVVKPTLREALRRS
ncbi:hypothetical protein [Mycobacterium sp.]|uniref:hypothetical protein n=1 Tax=Mycobacterium sp. TaxID=1785 RepID=UPI003F9B1FD8